MKNTKTFKELRKNAGLNIEDVASNLGLTIGSYKKYECSSRTPSTKVLLKMQVLFKCTNDELINAIKYHTQIMNRKIKK